MEPVGWIGKAVGKYGLKITLKRSFRWINRWFHHNILDKKTLLEKYQEAAKTRDALTETTQIQAERLDSKDQQIEKRVQEISEVRRNLTVKDRLIESLEIKGISRQELIRKNLENPTPFLIVRTGGQGQRGSGDKWVKKKLMDQYGAETVGSSYVIPPDSFPEPLLTGKMTLSEWIEEKIDEENKSVNYTYVAWVDMEQGNLYWRRDFPQGMRDFDDRFPMDEYTDKDFYDFDEILDALQLVKKGDIAFFASQYVDEDEIIAIHDEQAYIEEELDNPDLKQLATVVEVDAITSALADYVTDPENVANGVKSESKIWYEEIYGVPD